MAVRGSTTSPQSAATAALRELETPVYTRRDGSRALGTQLCHAGTCAADARGRTRRRRRPIGLRRVALRSGGLPRLGLAPAAERRGRAAGSSRAGGRRVLPAASRRQFPGAGRPPQRPPPAHAAAAGAAALRASAPRAVEPE